jgi:hypothetical protein
MTTETAFEFTQRTRGPETELGYLTGGRTPLSGTLVPLVLRVKTCVWGVQGIRSLIGSQQA